MENKTNSLIAVHNTLDDQLVRLSAWVQTFGFVLEGLEEEGEKASRGEAQAVAFANRYPVYSEMLFLALSGLQDCKEALEKICEKEYALIRTTG